MDEKEKVQYIVVSNCGKLRFSEIMKKYNALPGAPGGLYGNSKTALLSPKNIRKDKKPIIYNI